MAKVKNELVTIELDKFSIEQLPELQNKKKEVAEKLSEFNYVEIVDHASYDEAKKSRTGIRSIRTELQKEQKDVDKKIKDFVLSPVKNAYTLIIDEVIPVEDKQQAEVSRWENIKETERLAKVRAEEERVAKIRETVVNFENECNAIVGTTTIENVKLNKEQLDFMFNSNFDFMEFQQLFEMAKARVQASFDLKCGDIQEKEDQRLENERIKAEQVEQKRVFDIKEKISAYKNKWLIKLSDLTFEESKNAQKEFSEEKALDCYEYQEDYLIVRTRIKDIFETTIKNLKTLEENRLEMERFQKEKAEFEAKLEESKFQERCKQIIDLGFVLNETNIAYQKGLHYLNLEDIKLANEYMWLRELEDAKNVKNFSEIITVENYTEEVEFVDANTKSMHLDAEIAYKNLPTTDYNTTKEVFEKIAGRMIEAIKEQTWDSLWEEFKTSEIYTSSKNQEEILDNYIKWLEFNYNAPTKKE